MAQKPETRLQKKIQTFLQDKYPDMFIMKVHGSAYQRSGIPDLLISLWGHFVALEVKMPGKIATPLQIQTIMALRKSGATAGVVTTVEEADGYIRRAIDSWGGSETGEPKQRHSALLDDKARIQAAFVCWQNWLEHPLDS